jgi:hypothetical protein
MKFYRVDSTNYAFLTKSVGKCKGSGLFCKHFDSSENFQVLIYFRYADVKQQNENTEIIQVSISQILFVPCNLVFENVQKSCRFFVLSKSVHRQCSRFLEGPEFSRYRIRLEGPK